MAFNDYEVLQQQITNLEQQINCIKSGDCCAGLAPVEDTSIYTHDGIVGAGRLATLTDTLTLQGNAKVLQMSLGGNIWASEQAQGRVSIGSTIGTAKFNVHASLKEEGGDDIAFFKSFDTLKYFNIRGTGKLESNVDTTNQAWEFNATDTPEGLLMTVNGGLNTAVFVNTTNDESTTNGVTSLIGVDQTVLLSSLIPLYSSDSASVRGINTTISSDVVTGLSGHVVNTNILGGNSGVFGSSGKGQGEVSPWIGLAGGYSTGVHGSWTRQDINGNGLNNSAKSNFAGLFEMYDSGSHNRDADAVFVAVRGHTEVGSVSGIRIGAKFTSKKYGGDVEDLTNTVVDDDIALLVPGLTQGNWGNVVFGADTRRPTTGIGNIPSTVEITGDLEFRNATSGTVFTRPDGVRIQVLLDNTNTFVFNTLS